GVQMTLPARNYMNSLTQPSVCQGFYVAGEDPLTFDTRPPKRGGRVTRSRCLMMFMSSDDEGQSVSLLRWNEEGPHMPRVSCWLLLLVLAVPGTARAQGGTPVGPEFRVNTYTTGYQDTASVSADSAGNFIVVWDGQGADDPITGIFGQRFAASGTPLGPEFRVNASTTDLQVTPSVAASS